jgi:hypothetical protein
MRKIASIVNTSVFQAQILTEVVTMLLSKCESLLKLIIAGAEEDNSAKGYLKWMVKIDPLAHEVLYDVKLDGKSTKIVEPDDNFCDTNTLGSMYKCIKDFVKLEILSEDYIRTLYLRYITDDNKENLKKLDTM